MRTRSMVVVALPALLALALLQPRAVPAPAPEPSADQIDAAVRHAQADAGLASPAMPHRR